MSAIQGSYTPLLCAICDQLLVKADEGRLGTSFVRLQTCDHAVDLSCMVHFSLERFKVLHCRREDCEMRQSAAFYHKDTDRRICKQMQEKITKSVRESIDAAKANLLFRTRHTEEALLHSAIEEKREDAALALVDLKVFSKCIVKGETALYRACRKGSVEIAKALLRHEADANQKSDVTLPGTTIITSRTPLEAAIEVNNEDLVRLLLEHKVPLQSKNNLQNDPLWLSIKYGREKLALSFLEKNISLEGEYGKRIMAQAVWGVQESVVRALAERGVDPAMLYEERSLLDFCVERKESGCLLSYLLQTTAKKHLNRKDSLGFTPLGKAACFCALEYVKLLLETGAVTEDQYYKGQAIIPALNERIEERVQENASEEILGRYREILALVTQHVSHSR